MFFTIYTSLDEKLKEVSSKKCLLSLNPWHLLGFLASFEQHIMVFYTCKEFVFWNLARRRLNMQLVRRWPHDSKRNQIPPPPRDQQIWNFPSSPCQAHNTNYYGRALMSALPQAIAPNPHTNLQEISNFFLHTTWEQQTKESVVVGGNSYCVNLQCLVTSIACITW
jgi:hypothetical protein